VATARRAASPAGRAHLPFDDGRRDTLVFTLPPGELR
jgi:hypothetical protein